MAISQIITSARTAFSVRRFSVHESISSPFTISIWARSEDDSISMESVVGKPASFRLETGYAHVTSGGTRLWAGICSHFQQLKAVTPLPGQKPLHTYHARIVPTFWLLTQRRNHRIFQHVTVPDIVKKILGEWKIEADWKIDAGKYHKLEYKVQYGETDYAFISRLLEEVGIAFAFLDPNGEGAKLTFGGAFESGAPRPGLVFTNNPNQQAEKECVKNVRLAREVRPGAFTMRDHDFRRPAFELFGKAPNAEAPENRYEQYVYDPGTFLVDDGKGGDTPVADDKGVARYEQAYGQTRAEQMLHAERMGRKSVSFSTNVMDTQAGAVFSILGHPHSAVVGKPLLVTDFSIEGSHGGEWTMSGRAVFTDMPFRPPARTPKPRALGMQSAKVVGPKGQEIHTDEFGRVRVQFPWDREGKDDDGSSCWIRVSQGWAGTGFGMLALPRIGQEVLVSFLDGDPEQPLVVGRVYNRIEPVPYALPENKTISTWKGDSSLGSDGFNELKFEDKKGDELFYEQAQKNRRMLVKNNETITVLRHRQKQVGVNETDTTGVNRFEVTGINRSETTGANRMTVIGGTRRKLIKKNEAEQTQGERRLRVGKNQDIRLAKKKRELVDEDIHLLVKGDRREIIEKDQSMMVIESRHEKVEGRYALETGKQIHLSSAEVLVGEAAEDITIQGPGGFIRIDSMGVTIKGTMVYINEGGKKAGKGKGAKPEEPELPGDLDEDKDREEDEEEEERKPPPPMDQSKFPEERQFMKDLGVATIFSNLGDNFEVLGPHTRDYNCIAHTLGDHNQWVDPITGPASNPLQGMDGIYGAQGYTRSSDMNFDLEPGKQKIVVYATKNPDGSIADVTHGAIQDEHGTWTSKLGGWPLIRHETPGALNGADYGEPVAVYEK
ncbi:type VI secretion system Vgr family protein [Polyangium mundeleinium]|uniref:Type VI secretion system tip protein TssI/VgrG n=1 Tax=Polyangium mundeleinium TaxID=2995306 RepID=A0ABT5EFY7_9BACT|nr:type VI secretion system tip protein TssI/VgrG [Polyangium mundeleinium]MDC0740691.1 type VI secretion system tip protein TssI/VgrG [Polyangium mundeleinium]